MDERERYLFDLQGFLAVPDALSEDQVAELDTVFDERIAAEVPSDAPTWRFGGVLDWAPAYRRLIDNPFVGPYLEAVLGGGYRLDHDYADLIRRGSGPIGTRLHGGATPFDFGQFYVVNDGRIRTGLTVVAYNLRDVRPGDGGFAAVPGSHKANFPFPPEWFELEEPQPFVQPVTGPAGTAIIFTEAMTHGTLPWRGAGERRTIFLKYDPGPIAFSARYYDASRWPDLTERERALLEPPNARYAGRPVS